MNTLSSIGNNIKNIYKIESLTKIDFVKKMKSKIKEIRNKNHRLELKKKTTYN